MKNKNQLKGFQGIFFDEETNEQLIDLQEKGLESNIENAPKKIRVILVPKYMSNEELANIGITPEATVEAEYGEKVIKGKQVTLAHHTKEYEKNPAPCNTPDVPVLSDGSTIVVSHIDLDTIRRNCSFNGQKKRRCGILEGSGIS